MLKWNLCSVLFLILFWQALGQDVLGQVLAGQELVDESPSIEHTKNANAPQSLNSQVQDLKQQVIELNRDLFILEEELLFPANTQIAIFVSMNVGEFFELDAVKVSLDKKVISNYLYTDKQVNALHRGGVQRLFVGNMKSGEHELVAVFTGSGPRDREYKRAVTLHFEKGNEAKNIELKIVDSNATQQPEFLTKEW